MNKSVAGTVEEKWQSLKCALLETAREVLGIEERRRREDWFDEECRESVARRNEAHRKYSQCRTRERKQEYEENRRLANKVCRKKKRTFENGLLLKMEQDFADGRIRNAYKYLKHLREGYKPSTTLCRDRENRIVSDPEKIKTIWREYFDGLLGGMLQGGEIVAHTPRNANIGGMESDPPSIQEIEEAISALRNNKAPGTDLIPAELLKAGGADVAVALHSLIAVSYTHLDVYKRQVLKYLRMN